MTKNDILNQVVLSAQEKDAKPTALAFAFVACLLKAK